MHIKFKRQPKRKQKNGKLETQSVWFCHFSVCVCVCSFIYFRLNRIFSQRSLFILSLRFFYFNSTNSFGMNIFIFFSFWYATTAKTFMDAFFILSFEFSARTCYMPFFCFLFRTIVYILSHSKTVNSVVIFKSPTILYLIWIRFQFKLINI